MGSVFGLGWWLGMNGDSRKNFALATFSCFNLPQKMLELFLEGS